jgi:hypothetical protein
MSVRCQRCGIDYKQKGRATRCFTCDKGYRAVLDVLQGHACPGCGREIADAPSAPFRVACDHRGERHHIVTLRR